MIVIRAAEAADAAAISAIYAPYVLSGTVSFETEVPDAEGMRARMEASGGYYPWIVATNGAGEAGEPGDVMGFAYATRFRERPAYRYVVETSIYLAGAATGTGTGRLLYDALFDTLRRQGFTQALAAISMPNEASVALHESVGFRRAGLYREVGFKQGRWIDVSIWQCELNESALPPVEPRPFREVGVIRD